MGFCQFSDKSIRNKLLGPKFSIICKNSLFLARKFTMVSARSYPYGFSCVFSNAYLLPQVRHKRA